MKWLLVALGLALACSTAEAVSTPLFLHLSSPNDLMHLTPGDTAVIDVSLAGLTPGGQLVSLTGSVLFPDSLLGTPLSISPGAIVPDATDFLDAPLAGQADGAFLVIPGSDPSHNVSQNGGFYSFTVQAQAAGSGTFALNPLALLAEQYDPQNPLLPLLREVLAGEALPFTISASGGPGGGTGTVIPAPPALGLAFLGLILLRRRRLPGS